MNWKIIGMALTGIGSALSLISGFVEDKRREEQIRDEVERAFAERENPEEEGR